MSVVMAIINGSGKSDPSAYEGDMALSFCKQISNVLGEEVSFYQRGPAADGAAVKDKARAAADWMIQARKADPDAQLCLAGHNRGGAAAVMAAEFLEAEEIPVHALFLFDAVALHPYPGGRVIPANVAFAHHALRWRSSGAFIAKYAGRVDDGFGLRGNPARPTFDNIAVTFKGEVHYDSQEFHGSHEAVGGAGWKDVAEDAACQQAVARWMTTRLHMRGIEISLTGFPPAARLLPALK